MLSDIKERATGWIAWIIVIIISIPFALWGVHEYLAAQSKVTVAEVAGQEISQDDYRQTLQDFRERLRRNGVENAYLESPEFKQKVLAGMVERVLLERDADKSGYRISDAQLLAYIHSVPQFQRDGKFDPDMYGRALANGRMTKTMFEARARRENALTQIRNGFRESAFVTPSDRAQVLNLFLERREYDYAVIRSGTLTGEINISDEAVKQEYEKNKEMYRSLERMKVRYLRLSVSDLASKVSVSEDDIRKFYESNRGRYVVPETRDASHILIKVNKPGDETSENEAREKARALAERARKGEDFSELAKSSSQDSGSARNGGELGTIKPGVMVKPFETALYGMARPGDISDPVKTNFGWHVIRLNKINPEQAKPFEETRTEVEKDLRQRRAEELFIEQAEQFRNLLYERSQELEPAADALKLKIETSDWITRDQGTGLFADPKLREVAFGDEVLLNNNNSEAVEVGAGTLIAVRRGEVEPARQKPLDEVKDQIVEKLKRVRATERAKEIGEGLVGKLRSGGAWDGLLGQNGLQSKHADQTRVDVSGEVPAAVTAEIFRANLPVAGKPVFTGVAVGPDYYVVRLDDVKTGDPATAKNEVKQRAESILEARRGVEYYNYYQDGLRKRAEKNNDIKIHGDKL